MFSSNASGYVNTEALWDVFIGYLVLTSILFEFLQWQNNKARANGTTEAKRTNTSSDVGYGKKSKYDIAEMECVQPLSDHPKVRIGLKIKKHSNSIIACAKRKRFLRPRPSTPSIFRERTRMASTLWQLQPEGRIASSTVSCFSKFVIPAFRVLLIEPNDLLFDWQSIRQKLDAAGGQCFTPTRQPLRKPLRERARAQ